MEMSLLSRNAGIVNVRFSEVSRIYRRSFSGHKIYTLLSNAAVVAKGCSIDQKKKVLDMCTLWKKLQLFRKSTRIFFSKILYFLAFVLNLH